ncbi:hypothetical protein WJX82_011727 [Trebouxia sp. C0006]
MCGIFGYYHFHISRSRRYVVDLLLAGLRRLEYRGYDSAGICISQAVAENSLSAQSAHQRESVCLRIRSTAPCIIKAAGNVDSLAVEVDRRLSSETVCPDEAFIHQCGLAHTRWATHGAPSKLNSHPHVDEEETFAVVHNGIITNYKALRQLLVNHGRMFHTDTDSEVVPVLCSYLYTTRQPADFKELMMEVISQLEGAFALLVTSSHYPGELMACKRGSPLVLGVKESSIQGVTNKADVAPMQPYKWGAGNALEVFVASDVNALVEHTKRVCVMEDNDIAHIYQGSFAIYNSLKAASKVARVMQTLELEVETIMKGDYQHFMQKEIFSQAESLTQTMQGRLKHWGSHVPGKQVVLGGLSEQISAICRSRRMLLIACGSSYHACLAARQVIEELTQLPVSCELGSDFMDRQCTIFRDDTCVFVSQSGETADTLQALRFTKKRGALCIGITNVVGSAIARETDCGVHVNAGCEIGVASTKAYTSQILVLIMVAVSLCQDRMSKVARCCAVTAALEKLPSAVSEVLELDGQIQTIAETLKDEASLLVFGRGHNYATALETALKVKEVALMHSEGILAGEMKHGPLALVDECMPVIVIVTRDSMYAKMHAVIQQLRARGARVVLLCNFRDPNIEALASPDCQLIQVPCSEACVQPIINIIALQLLSYHLALLRGHNVDQPRNLAKSVTVADDCSDLMPEP